MNRIHLFELEDLPWFPRRLRDGMTDFLGFVHALGGSAEAAAPLVRRLLASAGETTVIDLGSGGGGPAVRLPRALARLGVRDVRCVLTDKFPNLPALRRAVDGAAGLGLHEESVDATRVPADLSGVRTQFVSFHHFRPAEARRILADAAAAGRALGVFEFVGRRPAAFALVALLPWLQLLTAPLQRPFRLDRLLFTYAIPILPAAIGFDGLVSCLRSYELAELRELTRGLESERYRFELGRTRFRRFGLPVEMTWLLGLPVGAAGREAPARDGAARR